MQGSESRSFAGTIDPILLRRNVMDNTFTVPCQVPQFSKGFVRDKTALEQTGPKQCGDPLSILHVCLTSRNILHVSGVHYQDTDLTVKTGFQHLVNGLPVDSGAFHGNVPAFGFDNPVTQLLHFGMSVLKVRISASGSASTAPLTRQATMISR